MPHSLRSRIKKFHHQGLLSDKDRDRILNALDYEWIPTAERLPKKEEKNYWVCLNNGNQCQCRWLNIKHIFSDVKTDDWHWSVTDIDPFSKVIAWMPLPDVYKEDKTE